MTPIHTMAKRLLPEQAPVPAKVGFSLADQLPR
jgi:hypothetical protein